MRADDVEGHIAAPIKDAAATQQTHKTAWAPVLDDIPDSFFSECDFDTMQTRRVSIDLCDTNSVATGTPVLTHSMTETLHSAILKNPTVITNPKMVANPTVITNPTIPSNYTTPSNHAIPSNYTIPSNSVILNNPSTIQRAEISKSHESPNRAIMRPTPIMQANSLRQECVVPQASRADLMSEKGRISMEICDLMELIEDGKRTPQLEAKLQQLKARRKEIDGLLTAVQTAPVVINVPADNTSQQDAPSARKDTEPEKPSEWAKNDFPWSRDIKKALKQY
jgi:hypothetical protein